MCMLLKKGQLE